MSVVVITGANSGIGLATTLAAARAGHAVYAAMRDPARGSELTQIVAAESLPVTVVTLDVNSDDSVPQAFREILAAAGVIDVLVNNAGIDRLGPIEEMPLAEFRAAMETNYFGPLRCIQQVMPRMRERKSGCIISVSSIAGRIANAPFGAYAASKWALEAVSEALAQEAKVFNIRVALVEPGVIGTPMAGRVAELPLSQHYPQAGRTVARFTEALKNPTPASAVAEKILQIMQSGSWQFRHIVGADAARMLQMRASMTDEAWIELGSSDDETYYKLVKQATP